MDSSLEREMYTTIITRINSKRAEDVFAAENTCRICMYSDNQKGMITPCACAGTVRYVHEDCLKAWLLTKGNVGDNRCELCQQQFLMTFYFGSVCSPKSLCEKNELVCFIFPSILIIMGIVSLIMYVLIDNYVNENKSQSQKIYIIVLLCICGIFFLALLGIFLYTLVKNCTRKAIKKWRIHSQELELIEHEIRENPRQEEFVIQSQVRFDGVLVNTPEIPGRVQRNRDGSYIFTPTARSGGFFFSPPHSPLNQSVTVEVQDSTTMGYSDRI